MRKILWGLAGVVAMIGVVWTVMFDYIPWVHATKDNYGHGPGNLGTQGVANKLFTESVAGVRLNYPDSWELVNLWADIKNHPANEVATISVPGKDIKLTVAIYQAKGNLGDIADTRQKERESWGWTVWGDRQYISNDRSNITVMTWQTGQSNSAVNMIQEGLVKKGDRLMVVDISCPLSDWRTYKNTFWEILGSLVII